MDTTQHIVDGLTCNHMSSRRGLIARIGRGV